MGNKRHRKRRDSMSSEQKRALYVILLWLGIAVISVIIALIVGNALGKKAESSPQAFESASLSYTYSGASVPPIRAHLLDVSERSDSIIIQKINDLSSDVTAVSLYLRHASGSPNYNSETANAIFNVSSGFDLPLAVSMLHEKKIYVSACFDCNSFFVEDETARKAASAFEAAMIVEALNAGVDEIIICGLPVNDNGIAYASELFSEIRSSKPMAVIGAGIHFKNLLSDSGAAALKEYSSFADFCAVDTSSASFEGESPLSVADSLMFAFELYPLRLLIEISGKADFQKTAEELNKLGINNIQSHKYSEQQSVG